MRNYFIYALVGISGVGKSHLVGYALAKASDDLKKLVAVTTREKRNQERDGIDKHFLSEERFKAEKENIAFVCNMYGAYYGFWKKDLDLKRNLIVELYYKDYLKMKRERYPVFGIYVWTSDHKRRRENVKSRYVSMSEFFKREAADACNNIIHKIMYRLGLFNCAICNHYTEESEDEILAIVKAIRKSDDISR